MRKAFLIGSAFAVIMMTLAIVFLPKVPFFLFAVLVTVILIGLFDCFQTKHTIRRNFPVLGHGRYLMEMIRPEINQYFVESNSDGRPFSREERSVVYQRAKMQVDSLPFGTQFDVYATGYEWINHSLAPVHADPAQNRVQIGGAACAHPYSASLFNISAMSYGSLSKNAILALNGGAKMGGFYHNTGEGGLSPYHLEPGGDITWQIGTGYFGCRDRKGAFNLEEFKIRAANPSVKMIEIKLSQGAKPGHGGILPAKKVTLEISQIRGVAMGEDVLSPPAHSTFDSPIGLLKFVQTLREGAQGKPVGFKLCLGKRREFLAIVKAMLLTQIYPDFITVDGAEGGTGAAPLEFSDSVGTPLNDGLVFIHNALVGSNLRQHIRLIAAGKITTGFHIAKKIALGADLCNSARGMMFALGCIQALRCNTNKCPTGVATQDPELMSGLNVPNKATRVANFHRETIRSFFEVIGASGVAKPHELMPWHIQRRMGPHEIRHYGEIYSYIELGSLLSQTLPPAFARPWTAARAESFQAD